MEINLWNNIRIKTVNYSVELVGLVRATKIWEGWKKNKKMECSQLIPRLVPISKIQLVVY